MRWSRFRTHDCVSVVRPSDEIIPGRNRLPGPVPHVQAGHETGLAILPARIRHGAGSAFRPHLHGQAIHRDLLQPVVPRAVDAVHEILSLVPHEGTAQVEGGGLDAEVPEVRLGCNQGFLDALSVVRAHTAQVRNQ